MTIFTGPVIEPKSSRLDDNVCYQLCSIGRYLLKSKIEQNNLILESNRDSGLQNLTSIFCFREATDAALTPITMLARRTSRRGQPGLWCRHVLSLPKVVESLYQSCIAVFTLYIQMLLF